MVSAEEILIGEAGVVVGARGAGKTGRPEPRWPKCQPSAEIREALGDARLAFVDETLETLECHESAEAKENCVGVAGREHGVERRGVAGDQTVVSGGAVVEADVADARRVVGHQLGRGRQRVVGGAALAQDERVVLHHPQCFLSNGGGREALADGGEFLGVEVDPGMAPSAGGGVSVRTPA